MKIKKKIPDIQIPPYYVNRAAERLRRLKNALFRRKLEDDRNLLLNPAQKPTGKKNSGNRREVTASKIIAHESKKFLETCVNARFDLGDVKRALGKALSLRREGMGATSIPTRNIRPSPEPPPWYRLDRLPPEPPAEWVREAAQSRAPKMPATPETRLPPSRRAVKKRMQEQQDFLMELFSLRPRRG